MTPPTQSARCSVLQLMALVASTLLDLVKNLRAFAGILVVSDVSVGGSAYVL